MILAIVICMKLTEFWNNIDIRTANECWNWKLSLDSRGYGQMIHYWNGKAKHFICSRLAYALANDMFDYKKVDYALDSNLVVMHTCDNPKCCNPMHLKLGTYQENNMDMLIKGHNWVKLIKPETISKVRELYATKQYTHRSLGKELGIDHTMVSDILNKVGRFKTC